VTEKHLLFPRQPLSLMPRSSIQIRQSATDMYKNAAVEFDAD
jgi:hypothetical protein